VGPLFFGKVCPSCGGARYAKPRGASPWLASTKQCSACGHDRVGNFCAQCGAPAGAMDDFGRKLYRMIR
jgi:hypothetical protein